jgi:hypothetical protein
MSKETDLNEAALILASYIKTNKPHLFLIDEEINKTQNGIVDIQVKVYRGSVTDVIITQSKRVTFKRN